MFTRSRFFMLIMVVVLMISMIAGCTTQQPPAEQPTESSNVEQPKELKFGATYMTLNNPFFVELNDGIKKVVESKGGKLIALDPQLDINKQIAQVEDLIAQKVDLIFLNPVDWKGIKPALEAAQKANIPIIVVDAPVFDDNLVESTVASDNWNAGVLCAQHLIKAMGETGNVVILEHPTAKSAIDRTKSFEEEIAKYPGIKVVAKQTSDGQLEKAMPVMENILQANKDIDAVMCLNDPTALGAIAALESANRMDGVLVYGVDGSGDAKTMIKEGKLTATAAQFPGDIGSMAAEAAFKKLNGETIDHEIKVPVELIDKTNIDKYE
ncbi:MAG: sugar ABC transporter substrate-binding protein [Bacillota bacterium]